MLKRGTIDGAVSLDKEAIMKRLTHGRLVALVLGMTLATAVPASPGEELREARTPAAEPAETSRNHAANAHAEAVSKAADAVVTATKLDLDIRLVSHTSVLVAGDLR